MLNIQKDVILAPFTTFNIGGCAKYFVIVTSKNEVLDALRWAKDRNVPVFVLGGGSNLLISDEGFNGLVIKVEIGGVREHKDGGFVEVTAGAGLVWDSFVEEMVERGYSSIECMSGIPGTVGAVPVQNVDAYGQEARNVISKVSAVNLSTLEEKVFGKEECLFEYRSSIFKKSKEWLIAEVTFCLTSPGKNVKAKRAETLATRKSKSTLYDITDPNSISVGCFFVNPVLPQELFSSIKKNFSDIPNWPLDGGYRKVSAGWLVEQSGFYRGFVTGNVGISEKHALILINKGGAAAKEVFNLSEEIRKSVYNKFKVELEREPVLLGGF